MIYRIINVRTYVLYVRPVRDGDGRVPPEDYRDRWWPPLPNSGTACGDLKSDSQSNRSEGTLEGIKPSVVWPSLVSAAVQHRVLSNNSNGTQQLIAIILNIFYIFHTLTIDFNYN